MVGSSMLLWLFPHGLPMGLPALGLVLAGSAALVKLLPFLDARRRTRPMRRPRGAPITRAAGLREGARVTLMGRLSASGALPSAFPDSAALTLALSRKVP